MTKITLRKGFDAHFHARRNEMMQNVLPFTAQQFAGGVAMGNLPGKEVIDTIEKYEVYIQELYSIAPDFNAIAPLMITKDMLEKGDSIALRAKLKNIPVFKFIPGGLTTNGAEGLTLYDLYSPIFQDFLKSLENSDRIFSCHFEVGTERTQENEEIRPINQEKEAIRFLKFLLEYFPKLKIIVEHASSKEMISFIENLPEDYNVAATLTLHHAIKHNGHINPLLKCKPCIKNPADTTAVKLAMCSGDPRFFAGTDSAPHLLEAKMHKENPANGIFSAPIAMQGYVQIFDELGRLDFLENFISVFGPMFYGIEPSDENITLVKKDYLVPEILHGIPVLKGGKNISWSIEQ
jgi:dihydroorotase